MEISNDGKRRWFAVWYGVCFGVSAAALDLEEGSKG